MDVMADGEREVFDGDDRFDRDDQEIGRGSCRGRSSEEVYVMEGPHRV